MYLKKIEACRYCGNDELVDFLDLGAQTIQGSFAYPDKPAPSNRAIPLLITRCNPKFNNGCGLVQNRYTVPPEILYSNYGYLSSVTDTMKNHLKSIVNELLQLKPNSNYVLDIACNDGYALSCYPDEITKYGVDPSDVARTVKLENTFIYNRCYPMDLNDLGFDIISAFAVLYDIGNLNSFLRKVNHQLNSNGVFAFEVAYLPSVFEHMTWDQFVHEHISTFSFAVLERICKDAGLRIFNARLTPTNGGSILCFACHSNYMEFDKDEYRDNLNKIRIKEFDLKLDEFEIYENFECSVEKHVNHIKATIDNILKEGKIIHLMSASTKGNVLLQAAQIGPDKIKYAAERTPAKIGAKTISGIEIISEQQSLDMNPDYYLVLCWHFKTEIIERYKSYIENGGKLIFPMPILTIHSS